MQDRPVGFFREGGKKKPRHEKKGVNETDLNISEKGSNTSQKIEVKIDPTKRKIIVDDDNHKVKIGDRVRVEDGSGIDSGKIGVIIGKKPSDEFPMSSKDWYQIKVEKPEIQKGITISVPKSRLEVLEDVHTKEFAPETKRAYLTEKQDVDDLLKGRLEMLKKKHGDEVTMQSLMLTARPFQDTSTFVVTFTNPKTDKDYEQWYVNDKGDSFEVNRSH